MADMMTIHFYSNRYSYPDFCSTLISASNDLPCRPNRFGSRTGSIIVSKDYFTHLNGANYISFKRDSHEQIYYAWIDDVVVATDNSFEIKYTVDAWRTYRDKIVLDNQFLVRTPIETNLRDPLLGSTQPYSDVTVKKYSFYKSDKRTFVVQVRPQTGEISSRTPAQPCPYQFFFVDYDVNNWTACTPLVNLMGALAGSAETRNIVTMYSIPYMYTEALPTANPSMPIYSGTSNEPIRVDGFKFLGADIDPTNLLMVETAITFDVDMNWLMRTDHSVQLVIPDAGIMNIPDELAIKGDLKLRQDIDLYSGAVNYMLVSGNEVQYAISARGSSVTSIPILSDPYDTYMSQNQNALTTSLMGDVASVAIGVGTAVATGGIGAAFAGGTVASGLSGIIGTMAGAKDAGSTYSNPPAFLGSATVGKFNQTFWSIITNKHITNAEVIHSEMGYPYNMLGGLWFPAGDGDYIETQGCSVYSTDGSVPRWALQEINQMFDTGVQNHTS